MVQKIFYSIAITALLLMFYACSSNDDDGKKGNISNSIIGGAQKKLDEYVSQSKISQK